MLWMLVVLMMDGATVKTFEALPDESDEYLSAPFGFVFAPNGNLYVADSNTSRIHIWDKTGKYLDSFGTKGEGPGEFFNPVLMDATDSHLWIIDTRGSVSKLTFEGVYVDRFRVSKPRLRRFAAVSDASFLITARYQDSPRDVFNHIESIGLDGETTKKIKHWRNHSFTTPREGDNHAMVKAFPPAAEIQKGADGLWRVGFSESSKLWTVNAKGEVVGELLFELPSEEVTDDEKTGWMEMPLPCAGGGNFLFKNFENIKTDFSHDKAYYTRFAVGKDTVTFLQTPDGGIFSCEGYPKGNWFVCDLKTGKLLDRGRFDFPEGSMVFVRHGRILGFIMDEDEEFKIQELSFPGR